MPPRGETLNVPPVCVLDPDGDIVRCLKRSGRGTPSATWGCYHSELYEFELAGTRVGVVGCATGAPYAVLVAEQMFACGCELLVSVTSSGQIAGAGVPPYFVLVTRALRDEGTSYHYRPAARFAEANPGLLNAARAALRTAGVHVLEGAGWPLREDDISDAPTRSHNSPARNAPQLNTPAISANTPRRRFGFSRYHM